MALIAFHLKLHQLPGVAEGPWPGIYMESDRAGGQLPRVVLASKGNNTSRGIPKWITIQFLQKLSGCIWTPRLDGTSRGYLL